MQGDFSALAGSWKALVYIDPGNTMAMNMPSDIIFILQENMAPWH